MEAERQVHAPRRVVQILFWECVQNLPMVAGFFLGLALWQIGRPWLAAACALGGSALGALLIWATEGRIVAGHREPLRVLLTNVGVLATLMIVFLAYLSASWSRWQTDLAFGLLAGALLGVAQDLAAGSRVGWGHVTAFALALGLGLVLIRGLAAILPVWANVAIVTAVISVVIGVVDYGLLRGEDV
ncbi:MAG: hypothetical protein PVJ34_00035 [Anaerolineae bacterium]|jgi:hypothetical protein